MKSLEQQFVEVKSALLDGKHCVEADLAQFTSFPTMEERLSRIKSYAAGKGITESKKIVRNNGSGSVEIAESAKIDERIQAHMIRTGCDYREAHCFVTGGKALPVGTREPASFTEARKERLRKAYKGIISEQDLTTMASRQIEP